MTREDYYFEVVDVKQGIRALLTDEQKRMVARLEAYLLSYFPMLTFEVRQCHWDDLTRRLTVSVIHEKHQVFFNIGQEEILCSYLTKNKFNQWVLKSTGERLRLQDYHRQDIFDTVSYRGEFKLNYIYQPSTEEK